MYNPFLITGYKSPDFFCDRESESKRIISCIKNNRNLTLYSLRRMGKTGLIKHVFNNLSTKKNYKLIYLDILPTNNLMDFIEVFAKSAFAELKSNPEKLFSVVNSLFAKVRPTIQLDQLTGNPKLSFDIKTEIEKSETLENIFRFLIQQNVKIVIAIDEFQRILYYPEKNVESLLRKFIQETTNSTFIFAGSEKHMMLSIFGEHSRPFYQSTEIMSLNSIPLKNYHEFIKNHFNSAKMEIDDEVITFILESTRIHTFYVQYLCNRIFSENLTKIDITAVHQILLSILEENKDIYYSTRKLISSYQWNLLSAIAKEVKVKMVTSKDFIDKYELTSPSSVQSGLKALLAKDLIYYENDGYRVVDVFMSLWFKRN